MNLERILKQYEGVQPGAIANSSPAAIGYFVRDAQKDIATLAAAYDEMGRVADSRKVLLAAKDAEIERLRDELNSAASLLETLSEGKDDVDAVMMQVMAARNRAALNPESAK